VTTSLTFQIIHYLGLIEEAKDFINDPVLFKINLLMALFQPVRRCDAGSGGLANLVSKYSIVLRRRLAWMAKSKRQPDKLAPVSGNPDDVVCRIHHVVQVLNQLARIIGQPGP
jgi:hypothetical protein